MSKIDVVRGEMMAAMKAKNKPRKDALSMLLTVLKNKQIDKRAELTEEEENEVVLKEIKQTKESIETSPSDRTDYIQECEYRISVYEEFAPKFLSEEEIKDIIKEVLTSLSITAPTAKDKGKIMKELMPKVKGKSDGKVVNQLVSSFLAN
ncbi:MAG: GatB/YqeY domain-containing protein [bacterium]|nr:GatB/YqeY domain-containing protein [bacterium]